MPSTPPPIKMKKVAEKIYCVLFKSYREMGRTMLRFSEHSESTNVHFRTHPFTLKEFKEWYRVINGKFSYYLDWGGYNINAEILRPFYEGKFKRITVREAQLLHAFRNMEPYDFYIIGIVEGGREWTGDLGHELSHAMFRVNKTYQKRTTKIINRCRHKLKTLFRYLRRVKYCKHAWTDEAIAYLIHDSDWLAAEEGVKIDHLRKEIAQLRHLFKIHKPKNGYRPSAWKKRK